ncbi:F-box domain-containing protein [Heracleum sosnowskyi]|uniref:F-box domain-containing protein n=1 Tax=Heracleum sosnowskyi TaxID=360622 RepID=A0AAD8MGD0_9APIA|nr:F-box domain-containing protein [Heracleum sosnowskyi]
MEKEIVDGHARLHYQNTPQTPRAKKRQKIESRNKTLFKWNHLPPDLMRLVTDKLNYEERICLRATCKNWNAIKQSVNDIIHDMPLSSIALILMKTANARFKEFFDFLIFWIKGQTQKTVKDLLDHIPIQELYHWGHDMRRPNESMFTYFMAMAQRLGNMDAEFYWVCKSVVLRNHVYYDILEYSYKIIKDLSEKGHMLSLLFKNMIDIYFFPQKRENAVNAIIFMITLPETKQKIPGMIMALKKIGGQIYPDTIFDALSGTPICTAHLPSEDTHYQPDGYPAHPDQMDDFTCLQCKVALLMGCLSAYLAESIDFYLDLY